MLICLFMVPPNLCHRLSWNIYVHARCNLLVQFQFFAHAYKNAKVDSLMAELLGVKQQRYPHMNIVSDKVRCAINENSHHFFFFRGLGAASLAFILISDRLNVSHQPSFNLQCKIKTDHG